MAEKLNPELERRLKALENPAEVFLGVVLPVIVLIWGWQL